jgi:hypothetical protein
MELVFRRSYRVLEVVPALETFSSFRGRQLVACQVR